MPQNLALRRLSAGVLLTACLALPVGAQASTEWGRCAGKDTGNIDQMIDGCSMVIQSGTEPAERLALAFVARASAYMTRGDYDRAIHDYDRAVALDSTNSLAFSNRGFAYAGKGSVDRAIEDYDKAIQLNPESAM